MAVLRNDRKYKYIFNISLKWYNIRVKHCHGGTKIMQAPLVKTMFVDTLAPGNTPSSADIILHFNNSISSDSIICSCLPFVWVSKIFTDHNENKKCLNIYFSKEFTSFPHWGLVQSIYRSVGCYHWFRSWPVVSSAPSYYPNLALSHYLNKHCPLNPRNKLT